MHTGPDFPVSAKTDGEKEVEGDGQGFTGSFVGL